MLILEGEQGFRKSSALMALASDEFFPDTPLDLKNKIPTRRSRESGSTSSPNWTHCFALSRARRRRSSVHRRTGFACHTGRHQSTFPVLSSSAAP